MGGSNSHVAKRTRPENPGCEDVQAARLAYQRAGVPEDRVVLCDSERDARRVMEAGSSIVVAEKAA